MMPHRVEASRERDGFWVAKVPEVPGLRVYGYSEQETVVTAEKVIAILLPEGRTESQRILAFYPGRLPDSARFAMQPFTRTA